MHKPLLLLSLLTTTALAANPADLEKLKALQEKPAIHLDLSNVDLRTYPFLPGKIDLREANISHSNLSGVNLSGMDLSGADLSYTDLSSTKLVNANLTGANLTCANLNQADLTKAVFTQAIVSGATFVNTNTTDITGYQSVRDQQVRCEW